MVVMSDELSLRLLIAHHAELSVVNLATCLRAWAETIA